MATSQTRTPKKAAKAPASRGKIATVKKVAAKKPAPKKAPAKKVATRPAAKAPARKAAPVVKPALKAATVANKKALAKAGPVRSASRKSQPKVAKVLDGFERLRALVVAALDDLKAKDVVEVDVRGKSSVADLLVVASGTSSRHVKSIADEVVRKAKQAGNPPIGVEGQREAEWVLVDLGDVIVHVMLPRTREFYALERLWSVGDSDRGFGES